MKNKLKIRPISWAVQGGRAPFSQGYAMNTLCKNYPVKRIGWTVTENDKCIYIAKLQYRDVRVFAVWEDDGVELSCFYHREFKLIGGVI